MKYKAEVFGCCGCCLAVLSGALVGGGGGLLSSLLGKWDKAECSVDDSPADDPWWSDAAAVEACVLNVTTSLTGTRRYELAGEVEAQEKDRFTALYDYAENGCTFHTFGRDCDFDKLDECTGDCWVASDEAEIKTKAQYNLIILLGALFVLGLGTMACCFCCLCCGCANLVRTLDAREAKCTRSTAPTTVGVPRESDDSVLQADNSRLFLAIVDQCTLFLEYLFLAFGLIGLVIGLYLGVVLYAASDLFDGSPMMALGGFAVAAISFLLVCAAHCILSHVRSRMRTVIEDVASAGGSQEDMQRRFVTMFVKKLEGKEGEKFMKMLTDAGVTKQDVEAILNLPPEQIGEAALEKFGMTIFVHVICSMVEDMLRAAYEEQVAQIAVVFLGMPAFLVLFCVWQAHFCITYTPKASSSILSFLNICCLGFLYLRYPRCFVTSQGLLKCALFVLVLIGWVTDGVTALSVICFIAALVAFPVWAACCVIYFWYITPLADAMVDIAVETAKVQVHQHFGLHRDPAKLLEAHKNLEKQAGRPGRMLKPFVMAGAEGLANFTG